MLRVPRATERAASRERGGDGSIGCADLRVVDVDAVRVGKGRVRAFPSSYAAAAGAQGEEGRLDPERAEAVEEIGLAGDDAVVDVGVAELADVNLVCMRVSILGLPLCFCLGDGVLTVSWWL